MVISKADLKLGATYARLSGRLARPDRQLAPTVGL
jgi:hypothetical protein